MRSELVLSLSLSLGLAACAAGPAELAIDDTGLGVSVDAKGLSTGARAENDGQKKPLEAVRSGPYLLKRKFFLDADGDGFGDASQVVAAYEPPAGYVDDDRDCDDDDPAIHPGADERCNGVDDDCNGDVEEIEYFGGHAYAFCYLPGEETDYESARERCADFPQEMDLAVITSEAERDFVRSTWAGIRLDSEPILNHRDHWEYVAWIGYSDQTVENVWVWADGYAHGYEDWCADEPNNAGNEDCAVTGWTADYEVGPTCDLGWNDIPCDATVPYVCEVVD